MSSTRKGKCETCAQWRATGKSFFGPTVDRSVRGWCAKHVATTFDSGHCSSHSVRRPEVVTLKRKAVTA